MKQIFWLALFLATGCSHKTIVKNCDITESGSYYVCDTVIWK